MKIMGETHWEVGPREHEPNRCGHGQEAAALWEFLLIWGRRGVISEAGCLEQD